MKITKILFCLCLVSKCAVTISAEFSDKCLSLGITLDSTPKLIFDQKSEPDVPESAIELLKRIKIEAEKGINTLFASLEIQPNTKRVSALLFMYYLKTVPKFICRALNDDKRDASGLSSLEALEKNVQLELYFYTTWSTAKYALDGVTSEALQSQITQLPRENILRNFWHSIHETACQNLNQRFELIIPVVRSLIISQLSEGEKKMREIQLKDIEDRKRNLMDEWRSSTVNKVYSEIPWTNLVVSPKTYLSEVLHLKNFFGVYFGEVERKIFEKIEEIITIIIQPELKLAQSLSLYINNNNGNEEKTKTFVADILDNIATSVVPQILKYSITFFKHQLPQADRELSVPYEAALEDYGKQTESILEVTQSFLKTRILESIPPYLQKLQNQLLGQIAEQMQNFTLIMFKDCYRIIRQIFANHEDRCDLLLQSIRSFHFVAANLTPRPYTPMMLAFIEPNIIAVRARNTVSPLKLKLKSIEDDCIKKVQLQIDFIQTAFEELLDFTYTYAKATQQSRVQISHTQRSQTGILLGSRDQLKNALLGHQSVRYMPTKSDINLKTSVEMAIEKERNVLEAYLTRNLSTSRNPQFYDDIQTTFDESLRRINLVCERAMHKAYTKVREIIQKPVRK